LDLALYSQRTRNAMFSLLPLSPAVSASAARSARDFAARKPLASPSALTNLAAIDQRKCHVVELRFFGGMSVEETAEALGVSPITVKRDWSTAKAWLHRAMKDSS
jgi:DNA-directed RNA polymerase specialized sigma24 family protein